MTKPTITEAMVEAGARALAGHIGGRAFIDMPVDRSELRQLVRYSDGYDINEPTQDDCLDAARACLEAALAVREGEDE